MQLLRSLIGTCSLASNLSRLLRNCDVRGWTEIYDAPLVGALQDQPPLLRLLQAAARPCCESAWLPRSGALDLFQQQTAVALVLLIWPHW